STPRRGRSYGRAAIRLRRSITSMGCRSRTESCISGRTTGRSGLSGWVSNPDSGRPPRPSHPGLRVVVQFVVDGVKRQFQPVGNAELIENIVQMILDRLLADEQTLGHVFVLETLRDQSHNFALPRAQSGAMLADPLPRRHIR